MISNSTDVPDVSVLLVTWNSEETIFGCLESILRQDEAAHLEIIVVDNASADRTTDLIRSFQGVQLIQTGANLGFAPAMNIAIQAARGRHLFFLNPDTCLVNNAIGPLARFLDNHPDAGGASPQLLNADGTVALFVTRQFPSLLNTVFRQFGLRKLLSWHPTFGQEYLSDWDRNSPRAVPCLSGAALMVPRRVYRQIGLMDTVVPMYFEDLDYCKRIANTGWNLYYYPAARITHVGAQSTSASPAQQLLVGMEDGEAPWLFLKRYSGPVHAAAFRVIIALGSLLRLSIASLRPLTSIGEKDHTARGSAHPFNKSGALLMWAITPRSVFYDSIGQYFQHFKSM